MTQPPFAITSTILNQVAAISESLGRLSVQQAAADLRLRRLNRIRTIQGSLAIEGNHLSVEQITAILAGKRVIAPPREVQEAQNALQAYDSLENWQPTHERHLLEAHATLMKGLIEMTVPDRPRSRLQKYRLTLLGRQVLATKDQHQ